MIYNYTQIDHDDFDQVCHDDNLAHEFELDLALTHWDLIPVHMWEDTFYGLANIIDDPDITEPYYDDVMEGKYS